MVIALFAALALAHDPGGCPPLSALERVAEAGRLDDTARACLVEASSADGHAAWLLWTDRVAREGPAAGLAELPALLERTTDPDVALEAAERLGTDPAAALAAERARQLSDRWGGAVQRADRLARLDAVTARLGIPALQPLPARPPTADDLLAASDLGSAWCHALWGKAYATERDAVLRAAEAAQPGPGRDALARLALLLAVSRPDDPATAVVLEAVRLLLPGDPALAAHGLVSGDQAGEGAR